MYWLFLTYKTIENKFSPTGRVVISQLFKYSLLQCIGLRFIVGENLFSILDINKD